MFILPLFLLLSPKISLNSPLWIGEKVKDMGQSITRILQKQMLSISL